VPVEELQEAVSHCILQPDLKKCPPE
jgi:hypothetical protein